MTAFDWNIILGNLMDNAIEAAEKSEDRFLQIRIRYQRGMLFIQIRNSYSGERIMSEGRYLSTKDYDRGMTLWFMDWGSGMSDGSWKNMTAAWK